jgi:protein-glutamine gamma-glutamyltransferase
MAAAEQFSARVAHPVIQRFFEVSLYLLLFTGFAMLAGTSKLDLFSVVLGIGALLIKGYLLIRRIEMVVPERWTTYLTLGYVVFFAIDYFLLSQTFLGALVHMVLFAAMVKLFSIHRDRDYVYLGVLSFGMVLAAAVLTVDSLFFAIFCLFVLLAVMTFVSMEMRRSWIAAQLTSATDLRDVRDLQRLPSSVAGACVLLVLAIVLGTIGLFFVIPRKSSSGYLEQFAARTELSTGFSEDVRLGEIGQIQQSSAVVMHVKFSPNGGVPRDLRWRGIALTTFDGRRWTRERESGLLQDNTSAMLAAMMHPQRVLSVNPQRIRYTVSLEPFGARVFFVLPEALVINGRYQMVRIDPTGTIFNFDTSRAITDYSVLSQLAPPMPPMLNAAGDKGVADIYLHLPSYLDARVPALAERIAANEPTSYLKASAIERYLASTYGYTLQLPTATPRDPIANFLFERKQGHCEYFASSMAIMLRTLGIPSRIVNGFRGGEYNDLTDSYIVRAKDAHSWVEAYFPGYGWYTFDPTPSSPAVPGAWNRMYLYMDAMREFWHEWVVNYDTGHQNVLGFAAIRQGRSGFERLRDWSQSTYQSCLRRANALRKQFDQHVNAWILWTAGSSAILLLLFVGPGLYAYIRRMRVARKPSLEPQSAATIWYQRALKLLARRGMRKSGKQTPQEFLLTVPASTVRQSVQSFTTHYERARFGDSAEDADKLPELYRDIEESVKK